MKSREKAPYEKFDKKKRELRVESGMETFDLR